MVAGFLAGDFLVAAFFLGAALFLAGSVEPLEKRIEEMTEDVALAAAARTDDSVRFFAGGFFQGFAAPCH